MTQEDILNQLPVVFAGFPSPADEYLDPDLDFNAYLRKNKSATIPVRVKGDSMVDAFIPHNSIVMVDRSIRPPNNSIVVATLNGENVIKQLVRTINGLWLLPANGKYESVRLTDGMDFTVWGVARHVIIDL
jgi:DNA polymerase V